MELPDIKVLPVSAAAAPRLRAVLVGYRTHATAGARCRCGLRFYLDGSVGGARAGCKRAVVVDRQAQAKKRTDEAARFNRKGAAAWRLVRLPSMLGALLEDSRSMPAPVGPAKRPAFEADNGVVLVHRSFYFSSIYARLTLDQDVAMRSF
jgi:hypothetical protein